MSFYLPQTIDEWLAIAVPLATLVIGLAYLLAPRTILRVIGLSGDLTTPNAFAEGRSRFAGFMIGLPVAAILLGQPVIGLVLGAAHGLAVIGKAIHVVGDGARMPLVLARLVGAVGLTVLAAANAVWQWPDPALPEGPGPALVFLIAAVTMVSGLLHLLLPRQVMLAVGLAALGDRPAAHGELRGNAAAFRIAAGLAGVIMSANVFIQLMLAAGWLMTAIGHLLGQLTERPRGRRRWLRLLAEAIMGSLCAAVAFGVIG